MINFKQQELIEGLIDSVREKFPEVELVKINESPEDPADLWLNVTAPENEDRLIELLEFASNKSSNILLDYGYQILVMPTAVRLKS
ncbi:hypothetical protein HUU05_02885 [candidate division KSB1 bacterium]|nr:hypothetical protein [candidate division KSB1 bacterium]